MSCEDNKEHGGYCNHCFTCPDCLEENRQIDWCTIAQQAQELEQANKRIAELTAGLLKFKADYLEAGHDDCGRDNALDDVLSLIGEKWYE